MDRDASDVIAQLSFDDQLPAQVQLAVHGAVRPLLLPPLNNDKEVLVLRRFSFRLPSCYHFTDPSADIFLLVYTSIYMKQHFCALVKTTASCSLITVRVRAQERLISYK